MTGSREGDEKFGRGTALVDLPALRGTDDLILARDHDDDGTPAAGERRDVVEFVPQKQPDRQPAKFLLRDFLQTCEGHDEGEAGEVRWRVRRQRAGGAAADAFAEQENGPRVRSEEVLQGRAACGQEGRFAQRAGA